MEKEWIKIQTYTDAIQGEIVKQMLEEHGIRAVLLNKQDSSFLFGKIDLFINEYDLEKANRLIEENYPEENED